MARLAKEVPRGSSSDAHVKPLGRLTYSIYDTHLQTIVVGFSSLVVMLHKMLGQPYGSHSQKEYVDGSVDSNAHLPLTDSSAPNHSSAPRSSFQNLAHHHLE